MQFVIVAFSAYLTVLLAALSLFQVASLADTQAEQAIEDWQMQRGTH